MPGRGHDVGLVEQPACRARSRCIPWGRGSRRRRSPAGVGTSQPIPCSAPRRTRRGAPCRGPGSAASGSRTRRAPSCRRTGSAVKMPESMLAFTWPSAAIIGAPPIAKPTRQPVMLKVFERLWNSIATLLGPGDLEDARGRLARSTSRCRRRPARSPGCAPRPGRPPSRRTRRSAVAAGRVVRVVEEHQPGQRVDVGRDGVEVGAEAEPGLQRHACRRRRRRTCCCER